jgi:two-component system response regulator MtrA
MPQKILVVEDEQALNHSLREFLAGAGYETHGVYDGGAALSAYETFEPDLILLDVMIPVMTGIEVCAKIRETSGVPIIMLTALTDQDDVIKGLEAGADDYIKKPFEPAEFLARVKARLRPLPEPGEVTEFKIGPVVIDVAGHEVRRDGERVSLTPLEFSLLQTLAEKPKQVFSREMLLEKVWGYQYKADTRLVNVHVQRLRSKIEDDPENPKIVVTERGVGYKAGQA